MDRMLGPTTNNDDIIEGTKKRRMAVYNVCSIPETKQNTAQNFHIVNKNVMIAPILNI